MPSTNPGAHDPSEVEAVKENPPEGLRPDGTLEDPPPVPLARRRRLVRRVTRRYLIVLGVAALMVVTAVTGLAVGGDEETVIFRLTNQLDTSCGRQVQEVHRRTR